MLGGMEQALGGKGQGQERLLPEQPLVGGPWQSCYHGCRLTQQWRPGHGFLSGPGTEGPTPEKESEIRKKL